LRAGSKGPAAAPVIPASAALAMNVARRRGLKRAVVALGRRLETIMHRMWSDETEFLLEQKRRSWPGSTLLIEGSAPSMGSRDRTVEVKIFRLRRYGCPSQDDG